MGAGRGARRAGRLERGSFKLAAVRTGPERSRGLRTEVRRTGFVHWSAGGRQAHWSSEQNFFFPSCPAPRRRRARPVEPPLAPRARRRSEGVCVRLSLSELKGGGGWVAELREGDGWAEGWVDIDLETVTTSCSYLFSGRAGQECVCAPAPVRTSIPRRQGTNMATPHPPPPASSCSVCSIPP